MSRHIFTVQKANGFWKGYWGIKYKGAFINGGFRKTKAECIKRAKCAAKAMQPSQLRIKLKNGRIQTEYTYPRSSDPRRTKG